MANQFAFSSRSCVTGVAWILRQRDRFVRQKNQIRSGLGMRESEIEAGPSSLGDRDAVLAPAGGEDFRRESAGGVASPYELLIVVATGCIIGGRIILPLIDSTTMAANSRAASRLNSTS
jgi:hypothetical protein